jgi:hypothetical protein
VSERAELLRMLRRIRRRARGLAAVEGAVAGAAVGFVAVALGALVWRARGGVIAWHPATLIGAATFAVGAALAAARPISLVRCARLLDAAIDRGGRPCDRVLSALSFTGADSQAKPPGGDAPLARAALADAVARARAFAPTFVAPARRPRGLPALAGAALALLVVGAWPARAPGARRDGGRTAAETAEPRLRVATQALDAERAEVVAAATAAEATGDVSLHALAREARATLDALSDGALGRGEALDRLTTLTARAKEAADEAAAEEAALRAAGQALDPTTATRPLGHALGADDPAATQRALDALAERATASETARAEIASALGAAAAGVAGGDKGDGAQGSAGDQRRRLNRDSQPSGAGASDGPAADPTARRLEQLRRDLEDTAAACRGSAAACADHLHSGAGQLPSAAREAAETSQRRRLENAVRQMRERLRRGDLDERAQERRFGRVARGAKPESERGAQGGDPRASRGAGDPQAGASDDQTAGGEGGDEVFVDEPGGEPGDGANAGDGDSAGRATASADGEGAPRAGDGAGHEAGGDPLGRGATPPTRGHAREVRVRGAAGPTRSEVIEASARRGFAAREYVRVFSDYQPVVEESLASSAVPEGRRYVVRRYFQLIRPRGDAARTP